MEIAEDPYLPLVFFLYLLHQVLHSAHFRMEIGVWVNPLSVKIHPGQGVSVIANYDPIWVHARYQNKCVEPSQVLGFSAFTSYKVINTLKHLRAGAFSRMDPGSDQHYLVLLCAPLISRNDNLIERNARKCLAKLSPMVIHELLRVFNENVLLELVFFHHFWNTMLSLTKFLDSLFGLLFGLLFFLHVHHTRRWSFDEWHWLFEVHFIPPCLWHQNFFFVVDIGEDLSIRHWLGKCKIYRIIIVLELIIESECVVVEDPPFLGLLFNRCWVYI
jgi:hypothetical protein